MHLQSYQQQQDDEEEGGGGGEGGKKEEAAGCVINVKQEEEEEEEEEVESSIKERELEEARRASQKLKYAILFCFAFMICEVIGGIYAKSLAILTDAAHLLSDVAGFLISLIAIWLGTKPSTKRLTFGFYRAEVLGALLSVLLIWALTGILVYEAVLRTIDCLSLNPNQDKTDGKVMFIVALCGFFVNLALMKILGHGHGGHGHSHGGHGHNDSSVNNNEKKKKKKKRVNININAAYIHALGDMLQSIGVCIAGLIIWVKPEWQLADPIATFLFSIVVLTTTVGIVKSSFRVLMEASPDDTDCESIKQLLLSINTVTKIHDLHVWSLTVGKPSLSVHLVVNNNNNNNHDKVLHEAQRLIKDHFEIDHTTIQIEDDRFTSYTCEPCDSHQTMTD